MSSFSLNWPNVVTVTRMGLVFVVVLLAYGQTTFDMVIAGLLAVLIIIGDWLDGHLARKLDQSTKLGSVLDIAADRMLEAVLWILLADLNLIPVWIPIIVIARGIVTDSIRGYVLQFGFSGFGKSSMQKTMIGRFLTGSPIMRTGYALLKAFSFGWLLFFEGMREVLIRWPLFDASFIPTALTVGYWTSVTAAIICIARGIPVVVEGIGLISQEDAKGKHA